MLKIKVLGEENPSTKSQTKTKNQFIFTKVRSTVILLAQKPHPRFKEVQRTGIFLLVLCFFKIPSLMPHIAVLCTLDIPRFEWFLTILRCSALDFGDWYLLFVWDLEFGFWNLTCYCFTNFPTCTVLSSTIRTK